METKAVGYDCAILMKLIPWWRWEVQSPWTTVHPAAIQIWGQKGEFKHFPAGFCYRSISHSCGLCWTCSSFGSQLPFPLRFLIILCCKEKHRGVKHQSSAVEEEEEEEERSHTGNYRWLESGRRRCSRLFIVMQNWKSNTSRALL